MKIKQLAIILFTSFFLCSSAFAEGSKFDRFATDAEVTAQTRDDVGITPASISYIAGITSAESLYLEVKEENTSAVSKGQVCAITGSSGAKIRVGLGDCDDAAKIRVVGIAVDAITQNGDGSIVYKGILESVDTRDTNSDVNPNGEVWAAGDLLWASVTAGGLTNVRPTSGRSIKVARTVKGNSNVDTLIVIGHTNPVWATAASGEDIVVRMGDSAGANKISYRDYLNNEVGSLDSDGKFTIYNDWDFQGNYALNLQNISDLMARKSQYRFLDNTNKYIPTGQDLINNYSAFSIIVLANACCLCDLGTVNAILASHGNGSYGGFYAQDQPNNKIRFSIYDGTDVRHVEIAFDTLSDQSWHVWSGTIDTTGNGGDGLLYFYKDSKLMGTGVNVIAALSSNSNTFRIGGDGNDRSWSGEIARVLTFNLALTSTEIKILSSGMSIPYKYLGASQTELMPNQVDRDFSGASAWADHNLSAYNETTDLTITANAAAQYCTCSVVSAPTTIGKRYRMTFDVANLVSTWTIKSFDGIQTIGTVLANGTGTSIEWTATTTGGYRIVAVANNSSADFDNFTLTQIGCVLQLEQPGIGHNQWLDTSGNELHGTVSGALPINLLANHQEKYVDLTVTGNGSFTLPKGYKIKSIIAKETAGNALTGGLDVGLSANGVEIVSGMVIGGSATVLCTLVEAGTIGATFMTADDTIYYSDGNDDGAWDSASLELRVQMQRLTLN